jgi:hypothetical protein
LGSSSGGKSFKNLGTISGHKREEMRKQKNREERWKESTKMSESLVSLCFEPQLHPSFPVFVSLVLLQVPYARDHLPV